MKIKKILSALLVCVMVVCAMSFNVFADEIDVWDGKSYSLDWLSTGNPEGTSGDKFYLNSAKDLAGFAYYVNNYASTNNIFTGDTVYLNVDVDLGNHEWTPIGTMTTDKKHFYGSFDGQGHTISNLKISKESGQIYGGLFGRFKGNSFKQSFSNLIIHNVDIAAVASSDGKEGAGALMGYGYDQIIDNVHVTGNVNISGNYYVGGLAGHSRSNISNSTVEATGSITGVSVTGGLVGYFVHATGNGYTAAINDCSVDGVAVESTNKNAGGLVGFVSETNADKIVIDDVSVSNVTVSATNTNVSYVAHNFPTVTNATVENVATYVAGEETIPSDSEIVPHPVAEVNGVEYDSVQEAIDAAKSGDTVEIYAGEYSPINISNKNITIKGTVGDNGELLTTIKGGDPAITGHSFNGTIKDIKIVDAWKVMYAEPAGNVTVDNVYVTGATYGFHLVAYSQDLTWTIQNSYMDLRWANSFGVYNNGYCDIIIRGNTFESTNPYYPDYGAIHVNSFLPSVTVEENIFGENAKIYIDASVTDTSKINISKNYHADGVENAFADDADGVTVPIHQYYTEVDEDGNLTGLVEIPSFDGVNINNLDDLKAFRDSVNEGNTYKGKTVVLNVDINLEGENWTPIGTQTNAFQGTFDGGKHTISNLTIDNEELSWAGLFGYAKNAKINNVNIKNVDIHAYQGVGAIAGGVYTGSVSNCHVSGTISLIADFAYAAGITSYGYVTVSDCSVIADGMGVITATGNGSQGGMAGGITGWRGEGKNDIINCIVKNLNITAWASLGTITGLVHYENTIDGCTVDNVNLYKTRVNGQASIGLAAGNWSGKADDNYTITITNNSFDNITINGTAINSLRKLYGSNYSYYDKEIKLVENGNTYGNITTDLKVVAGSVGDLEKAFAYADDGETITLVDDFELATTIKNTKNITLDLNGKTITGTDNATGSFALIEVQPGAELIITDASAEKSGKITLTSNNNRGWNAYSSVISNQRGKLIVNGGTIEHLGGTEMAYGIDNLTNGKDTYAETIINGGTIKSTYRGIRQFLNGIEAQNILTVNGGTIEGANKSIWMQDANASANPGKLTVAEGATLNGDVYLFVTAGSTEWPVEVSIAKAAVNGEVLSANVPVGYEVVEENGTYGVTEKAPALPTATVTELNAEDLGLTFALNFKADEVTGDQLDYYKNWYADFVLTVNKDVTFNAEGTADGYLSGQYDAWSENWVNVPFEDVTLKANTPLRIMEYAMELMGQAGLKLTYNDVYSFVKDFNCGVFFDEEFLAANPDFEVTLALNMYNPENETEVYAIGPTYEFEAPVVEETIETRSGRVVFDEIIEISGNKRIPFGVYAGIDSIDYFEVGFEMTINGKTNKIPVNTVYDSLLVTMATGEAVLTPDMFGPTMNYIYGGVVYLPTDADGLRVEWIPYAVNKDGKTIYGMEKYYIDDILPSTSITSEVE